MTCITSVYAWTESRLWRRVPEAGSSAWRAAQVKKPKFDLTKLMELHSDSLKGDVGMEMARPEAREAKSGSLMRKGCQNPKRLHHFEAFETVH